MGLSEELQTCSALFSSCETIGFQGYHRVGESAVGMEQVKNATHFPVLTENQPFSSLMFPRFCKPLFTFQSSEKAGFDCFCKCSFCSYAEEDF